MYTQPGPATHSPHALLVTASLPSLLNTTYVSNAMGRKHQPKGPKRIRTVQGSCWPCRSRRVMCDLQQPICQKCAKADVACNYNKRLLKWQDSLASRGYLAGKTIPLRDSASTQDSGISSLSASQQDAFDYFRQKVWPLLFVGGVKSSVPFTLALKSPPLLWAILALATTHKSSQSETSELQIESEQARLACISSLRVQLAKGTKDEEQSRAVVMTSIFLCMLDGYLNPQYDMAATTEHQLGAQAVINILGGPLEAISRAAPNELILLSEFASMDLSRALIIGERPYIIPDIWSKFDCGRSWWEDIGGLESLAVIFKELAQMAHYALDCAENPSSEVSVEKVQCFEFNLQAPLKEISLYSGVQEDTHDPAQHHRHMEAQSLFRAFRYCALIYLYRAICKLPTNHRLVQHRVQQSLESLSMLSEQAGYQTCALFPYCVAGAHSISDFHRETVMKNLDTIEVQLQFGNIKVLQRYLRALWKPGGQDGDWFQMFKEFSKGVYIL
ncbi:fungal-specific transcription factor domain-containing protein [Rhexocercosporidium sp. MPI-PUGE-AT-0058]|nr:fungal-specific transcription factor domain-containing protein [Rhexocercosporidium sp. MPI-PUGE-AT-0058]